MAAVGELNGALAAATNVRPEALPTDKTRIEFFAFRGELRQNLAKDDKSLEEALKDFEALLRLDAENVEALERAAELYAKLDEFEKAKECVRNAANLNPFDPRLRLLDGEIAVLRGERECDVEHFKDAVAVLTENLELGLSLPKTNDDVINGGDVWSAEIEAETLYWRARAYYRWQRRHRFFARGDLDDSLNLRADDVAALALRGDVLLKIAQDDDAPEHAELAGNDYRRVAELTADAEQKERALNKAARAYERAGRWDLCLDVCDEISSINEFAGWARLRRARARFYTASARQESVDWSAIAAELDAGLPGAINEEIESDDAFFAKIWALRVCCGLRMAAQAKDDKTRREIQTKILEAVDEACKADEDVRTYSFGENSFDLDEVGRAVALELSDEKKADFYARRKDEREARNRERKSAWE